MNQHIPLARQEFARTIGEELAAGRDAAFARLNVDGCAAMEAYTAAVDAAVVRTYDWALAQAAGEGGRAELAIAAVGGYGRNRLAPYSDIDVAVIVPNEDSPATRRAVGHIYHIITDAAHRGLNVEDGYAYYAVDEAFELEERTLSALLDARLITGHEGLLRELEDEVYRQLEGPLFLQWNSRTRLEARERAGQVLHVQEPDLKESPGGLRDLQCALWSASAVWRRPPAEMLDYLVAEGLLGRAEAEAARGAQDFLWKVRCRLHLAAGRKRDVLALDSHEAAAAGLGFIDEDGNPRPDALTAHYYRQAEALDRASRQILGLCEMAQMDVGDGYYVQDGRLWTRAPDGVQESGARVMRAFELAQKYNIELSHSLAMIVESAAPAVRGDADSSEAAASFLRLLQTGPSCARVLRTAQATSVLGAYIPELKVAMRLCSGEALHRFTVGEHLLRTVERLEVLVTDEAEEFDHHRQVYSELNRPEVLVLGALLHDVGRIDPERDHSEAGAEIAGQVAQRLGMPPEDVRAVQLLVRNHLLLDRVATLRDVTDQLSIEQVAGEVATIDFLKRLYLLTSADIMAVGPGLWTDVRRDQLENLYFRVLTHLLGVAPARASEEDMARLRERVMEGLLEGRRLPVDAVKRHCRLMPDSYFIGTQEGLVGVHISLIERLAEEKTVVDVYNDDGSQYTELTVVRHDDALPGLFSRLCAAIYANELDIHDARIHTRESEHAIVVDSLWITWRGEPVPEKKAETLTRDLRAVLDEGVAPEELIAERGRPRPESLGITHLDAHNDQSETHTVIEVVGRDQMGFLFRVTQALSDLSLNIHTAKITTRGNRAQDAFYVTTAAGAKLTDEQAAQAEVKLQTMLGGG